MEHYDFECNMNFEDVRDRCLIYLTSELNDTLYSFEQADMCNVADIILQALQTFEEYTKMWCYTDITWQDAIEDFAHSYQFDLENSSSNNIFDLYNKDSLNGR